MMLPRLLASLTMLAGPLLAQNHLGVYRNTTIGSPMRGAGAAPYTNPSVQWNRIDVERYGPWGYDLATPTMCTFTGLHCHIQDENGATSDTFSLVAFTADPALADFPLVAAPLMTTGALTLPFVPFGASAWDASLNFATAAQAPAGADVFVGVSQHTAWGGSPIDGISIWTISGGGAFGGVDLSGPAAPTTSPGDTYAGWFVPSTGAMGYVPRRQFCIEPILATAGGVASALHHNDPLHPAANVAPGTSCMFSGQFPDARLVPLNPGRADDLGMTFQKAGIPDGSPVFWLAELSATFAPPFSLAAYLPGSTGAVCTAPGTTLGFTVTNAGLATHVVILPPAARALLPGVSILQQAVALDAGTFLLHAGPAQISSF